MFGPLAAIAFLPWWGSNPSLGLLVSIGAFLAPMAFDIISKRRARIRQTYLDNRGIPVSERAYDGMWPDYHRTWEEYRFLALLILTLVVFPAMALSEPDPNARGRGLLALALLGGLALTAFAVWRAASPWFRVRWSLMFIELGPRAYMESSLARALTHDPELAEAGITVQLVPRRRA